MKGERIGSFPWWFHPGLNRGSAMCCTLYHRRSTDELWNLVCLPPIITLYFYTYIYSK